MIAVLAVAAALATSVAPHIVDKPVPPEKWLTNDDYPARALQLREQGSVRLGLTIDAKGKPIRCIATSNDKLPNLQALSCRLIMNRATFSPALDQNGAPVLGLLSQRINWAIPGERGTKPDWRIIPDIIVAVAE